MIDGFFVFRKMAGFVTIFRVLYKDVLVKNVFIWYNKRQKSIFFLV